MSTQEKEQYKVLSDKDRKRFDYEKKGIKPKAKKREQKEEEKKLSSKDAPNRLRHAESEDDEEGVYDNIET